MQTKEALLLNRTTGGWGPRSCQRLKQKQQELEDELLALEIYKQQFHQSAEESAIRTNYSGNIFTEVSFTWKDFPSILILFSWGFPYSFRWICRFLYILTNRDCDTVKNALTTMNQ
jgi:hypothetical protein